MNVIRKGSLSLKALLVGMIFIGGGMVDVDAEQNLYVEQPLLLAAAPKPPKAAPKPVPPKAAPEPAAKPSTPPKPAPSKPSTPAKTPTSTSSKPSTPPKAATPPAKTATASAVPVSKKGVPVSAENLKKAEAGKAATAAKKEAATAKTAADKKVADAKAAADAKKEELKQKAKGALSSAGSAAKGALSTLAQNPMFAAMAAQMAGKVAKQITGRDDIAEMVTDTAVTASTAHAEGRDVKSALAGSAMKHGAGLAGKLASTVTGRDDVGDFVGGAARSAGAAKASGQSVGTALMTSHGAKVAGLASQAMGKVTGSSLGQKAAGLASKVSAKVPASIEQTPNRAAFIAGLQEALGAADFDVDTLTVNFSLEDGTAVSATIPLGYAGFGDAATPFDEVIVALGEELTDQAVIDELTPMLTLAPEEVFVLKLILMLNSANKVPSNDGSDPLAFDGDDFILANVTMLLNRLEKTGGSKYAKSSQAAFDAVRDIYQPLLDLVQFPLNVLYARVVADMPGGSTEFIQSLNVLRGTAGHKARTALFTSIVPQLTAERNPLEKALFVYALLTHLQEYNDGFIKEDAEDFITQVINQRLEKLATILPDVISAMAAAGCDGESIQQVQSFLDGIGDKPRTAGGDEAPSLIPLKISDDDFKAVAEGIGSGLAYFTAVVDPYIRTNVLHRQGHNFSFAYDVDGAKEALVALTVRALGKPDVPVLAKELTDIYLRADDDGVDAFIKTFAAVNGYDGVMKKIQAVVAKAKAGVDVEVANLDAMVMDPEDIGGEEAASEADLGADEQPRDLEDTRQAVEVY